MAKKVSIEQMDILFEFTRKHYVEYYDLQCELADHLANAIETQWTIKPEMDFKEALNREFKKFGIFGFMDVVEKRQWALTKKYHKLIWVYFKEFFKLPKILLTLLIGISIFKLIELSVSAYMLLFVSSIIFSWYKLIVTYRRYNKKNKITGRKWLLEDIIKRGGDAGGFLYASYFLLPHKDMDSPSVKHMIFMAILFTVVALYQYIVLYVIPAKAKEHLLKTYPEYNM